MAEMKNWIFDPQYLRIISKSLSDTFVEYLLPQPVLHLSALLKSQSDLFREIGTAHGDRELIEELVHYLTEDESEEVELTVELRKVLHQLHDAPGNDYINCPPSKRLGAGKLSSDLIFLMDGSFLNQLSQQEACKICSIMCEKNFISKKSSEIALKKNNAIEICLEVLRSIRQRKPDWPFEFVKCLQSTQTLHTDLESSTSVPKAEISRQNKVDVDEKMELASNFSLTTRAVKILEDGPPLSSKFSDDDSKECNAYAELIRKEQRHMADFSDVSSDSDGDDSDEEAVDLSLREYQVELARDALNGKNTIICAPTGSGKTRVATHIILDHLQKHPDVKKRVAFLARTVPLVMQQFKSLKKYLPSKYQMENITGDNENSMSLHKLLEHYDVFVMTPRILENHVTGDNPLIPGGLAAFSLLVFDECHHTRKGEAYNTLMLSYLHTKRQSPKDLPQVVGLTASIGVEKAKDVSEAEKNILKICSNLDAVCISVVKEHEEEMKKLVPVPNEEIKRLKERDLDECSQKIVKIMMDLEQRALQNIKEVNEQDLEKLMKKIPQDRKSQQYGQWVVMMEKKAMAVARQPEKETNTSIRSLLVIADHLKAYNVALDLYDLVQWRDVLDFLKKRFNHFCERKAEGGLTVAEDTLYHFFQELEQLRRTKKSSNKNLRELKKVIKENLLQDDEAQGENPKVAKGIIFVRTRFLAHALARSMEDSKDGRLKSLGTSVFTGTEAPESEGGMTSTQQEEIIEQFMCGSLRLLVATSVAEEGLDIPECNLVIKYNHVGNEVTTVQMRGRSRKKGGKSVLLAFDSICKKEYINQYDATMMKNAIRNVSSMTEDDIRKSNEKNQEEVLKNDEIDKLVKQNEKRQLIDKEFKMVCKLCRQTVIHSKDIKTIDDSHHVVVNREFRMQVGTRRNKSLHVTGQMATYGSAICKGRPEKQASCGNILGALMIFSKIPFIVLFVGSFGFETGENQPLVFYNSWKKVPYRIKDIQNEDKQRCISDHNSSLTESSEMESQSSMAQNQGTPDGKFDRLPTNKADASRSNLEDSATSAGSGGSITQAKTMAQLQEPNARASAEDSGFLTRAVRGEATAPSNTALTRLPERHEVFREQGKDEVHAEATAPRTQQQDHHLAETQQLLQDVYLSTISTFQPPKSKIVIDAPESSFSSPLISLSESENED
ncbi:hypothetical protein EGW08_015912 [Elysia chlorotica]|uniref:RNA helicase n=1 Tax=Elysia chlorotica TaxID=188477 RepID=A0A3S1AZR6_ELYCH|nr:hypothetical protein EGW08_015912 [Elysia chlorotica]